MSDSNPRSPRGLFDEVAELRARVDALTDELARGTAAPPPELRCRRVVVVGPDDVERIVLEPTDSSASIRVLTSQAPGRSTAAELYAVDASDADPATVGVALTRAGDVVALLELDASGQARWWTEGHGDAADSEA